MKDVLMVRELFIAGPRRGGITCRLPAALFATIAAAALGPDVPAQDLNRNPRFPIATARARRVGAALAATQRLGIADSYIEPYTETIEGTLVTFEMVPVPGGTYEYADPDNDDEITTVEIKPFWIGKTEVTWDEFDVYMLRLDQPDAGGDEKQGSAEEENEDETDPDAISRPTKPYGAPDKGFGHKGYAALHLTYYAAQKYCKWLSLKTGKKYRLPTEPEWEYACRAGQLRAGPIEDKDLLDKLAWYWDNAMDKTHDVGTKEPNAWGIHDMLGNAAEWCAGPGSKHCVRGGSYDDEAEDVHPAARRRRTSAWNRSDPQIPKSKWWLPDAPFAGFRVVCEP